MKELCVLACASEPRRDRDQTVAEDPFGRGSIQSFGECRQHYGRLIGRGFQTVQGGVAASTERGAASLAAKGLDLLGTAMLAIPYKRVDVRIDDPEVGALLIGTGKAFSGYPLGGSPAAFHLTPGAYWRRGRSHLCSSEVTEGAIKRGAGFEKTVGHRASPPCL